MRRRAVLGRPVRRRARWPSRSRAPRPRAARWCSTTARSSALLREAGKVAGVRRARRRDRRSADDRGRAASSMPPASGSTRCATWTATPARRRARRSSRPARACTWSSTAPSCPATHALLVPKTADGRVLFAVPWLGKTILGTTDTPRDDVVREPAPFARRGRTSSCARPGATWPSAPTRADVRSIWVGLRPLVKPGGDDGDNTKRSRASTPCWSAARAWSP